MTPYSISLEQWVTPYHIPGAVGDPMSHILGGNG